MKQIVLQHSCFVLIKKFHTPRQDPDLRSKNKGHRKLNQLKKFYETLNLVSLGTVSFLSKTLVTNH